MFEITYHHRDNLQDFIDCGKAYKNGVYDFTFENRFIIYHAEHTHALNYIALDMKTGYASTICRRNINNPIKKEQFRAFMPQILQSIKYTGDRRDAGVFRADPIEVIDSIFRVVLPEYGYAVREEQVRLAKNMYKGMTEKLVTICEAEVGTGKTLAYLVAGLVAKHNNNLLQASKHPVTITTSSIELQKALVEKEIPELSKMLMDYCIIDRPISAVLRKGKEHYFCQCRYEDFMSKIKLYPEKYGKLIEAFEESNFASRAFDLDRSTLRPAIKSKICAKGTCCKCKHEKECRYRLFVNAATESHDLDFQITNHNMYIASMKMEDETCGRLLQKSDFVVIDEAHKFKECAEAVYGTVITKTELQKHLHIINTLCKQDKMKPSYRDAIIEAMRLIDTLFARLSTYVNEDDVDEEHGTLITLSDWEVKTMQLISEKIAYLEKLRSKIPVGQPNLGNTVLKSLGSFIRQNDINIWVEINENGELALCCTPKNIGKIMRNGIWDRNISHVLTSGTMSDGYNFDYFCHENGIDEITRHLIGISSTPSPFDYENHTRLYISENMPFPDNNDPRYIKAVADEIVKLVNATHGHTTILFTSYKVLHQVYELTKDKMSNYDVICMTRVNKNAISDFKKSKNGVLFASGSMWEGVNCQGDCLSSLIIPRLPFPRRSATMEQKKEETGNMQAFVNQCVTPAMLLTLRQGVGRLIRGEDDTGVVSILDSRAADRYKNAVEHVMRKYPKVETIGEIEAFFKAVKPQEYFE